MNRQPNVTLSVSNVSIDWSQSVDIVEIGVPSSRSDMWELEDPETGVRATGESYLDARRQLTLARGVKERVEQTARREVRHELSRQLASRQGRPIR